MKKISIVTPTYNEEENIEKLCFEIRSVFKKLNYDYEHIVIDNNSTDTTVKKLKEEVDHKVLDYKKVIFLVIIMIFYGLTILRVGFFLSTSIFLLLSYYFLGERRWKLMLIFSFPFVAMFMFLLHGVLNIYLRDPLLKFIGIVGW